MTNVAQLPRGSSVVDIVRSPLYLSFYVVTLQREAVSIPAFFLLLINCRREIVLR